MVHQVSHRPVVTRDAVREVYHEAGIRYRDWTAVIVVLWGMAIMFRFIAFIGRWSMLDIFVIALLCALVNFGFFTTVHVAPAAIFFSGVVLATMFAAISFDQRLLWDVADMQEQ